MKSDNKVSVKTEDKVVDAITSAIGGGEHIKEIDSVGNNDSEKVVKLDEEGLDKFNELMNDPSIIYLKEFIRITKTNKENVSEKFYNIILKLEHTLMTYNAPWYVPYYQAMRNAILVLIYINSNDKLLSGDDYKIAIDVAGTTIESLVDGFKPDTNGIYNTFPVTYAVKAIFSNIQTKISNDAVDLYTEYENNANKIIERKSKIKYDTIRMFIVLNELQQKYKKYDKLYNKLLLKAMPSKYRVKQPKANIKSEELLDAAGILIIEQQYTVEKFINDNNDKIGKDIIDALAIDDNELEEAHNNILVQRVSSEIPEIKELMEQIKSADENLKNMKDNELFKFITDAVNEIDETGSDESADAAAKNLFDKVNEKLPEELKGRVKTEADSEKESEALNDSAPAE